MESRVPSVSLSLTAHSSIRRRSGGSGLASELGGRRPSSTLRLLGTPGSFPDLDEHYSQDAPSSPSLTIQVEDTDVPGSRPTVLLVSPTPTTPGLHDAYGSSSSLPTTSFYEASQPGVQFSVGPRPSMGTRTESAFSQRTSASQVSRLPTPDYTTPSMNPFNSFMAPFFSFTSSQHARSKSTASYNSTTSRSTTSSSRSATSVDTGRALIIPAIGITDKFTHRWPRPQSLKCLAIGGGTGRGTGLRSAAITELEEGDGLGFDRVGKWTTSKWCLLLSVMALLIYGMAGLVCAVLTWFSTWGHADVMAVADNDILTLITLAASILVFSSLAGLTGTLLNSRPILAFYALSLWPAFISMLVVGYMSYKRATFSLDGKLNLAWSQYFTPLGRLIIQDSLGCCGYYDSQHDATFSKTCFSRTLLPGCKSALLAFESVNLTTVWRTTFALVPLHIICIVVALLCANHVTHTFGKGLVPRQYRLSHMDVRENAESILRHLAEAKLVQMPALSRASSGSTFREDKEEQPSPVLLKEVRRAKVLKDR